MNIHNNTFKMIKIHCIIFSLFVILNTLEASKNEDDENQGKFRGYVTIDGYQYFINTESFWSWSTAKTACEDMGMKVVSLETEREYRMVTTHLNGDFSLMYQQFWTSGERADELSPWIWTSTASEITYFNWETGYPREATGRRCMFFAAYGMMDMECFYDKNLLCEE